MGSLRRGLILGLIPAPAFAEVCEQFAPMWDGTRIGFWMEPVDKFANPIFFLLVLLVLPGSYFRHTAWQMGGIFAASFLTLFVSTPLWMADTKGVLAAAQAEGCMAPPYLSTAIAAAITVFAIVRAVRRLRNRGK